MAWTIPNVLHIAAGQTMRITYAWPKPGDRGVQIAMGHPLPGELAALTTERFGKSSGCTVGQVIVNGSSQFSCGDPKSAFWQYYVDIKNEGPNACNFKLMGGGVS